MLYHSRSTRPLSKLLFVLSVCCAAALPAAPIPAKLAALLPKEASEVKVTDIARMEFMTSFTMTASLPASRACNRNQVTAHAVYLIVKSFFIDNEIGQMQAEMTPSTSEQQIATMRRQLEDRRANWKGLNVGQVSAVREEKVGSGTILSIAYDSICADVNPDSPNFHEIKARAYFFNGRTEATVELENKCSDAEARAILIHIFERLDKTDFKGL